MIVDRFLRVKISELSPKQWNELQKRLTFVKENGDVVISYRKLVTKGMYLLPRGAWYLLPDSITYEDRRSKPELPKLKFKLTLDDATLDERFEGQEQALEAMLREQQGLLVRPPGTGKTQIALAFAAASETRTLVLVHTEDILMQWIAATERAIPKLKGKVGVIRGSECKIGHITIATVQTLNRSYIDAGDKWWSQWGAVIADEAHHVSAVTWEAVMNACPAFYRFGFTASPTRADGMHPTMRFIIGPIIHKQKFTSPVPLEVVPVSTDFKGAFRGSFDWSSLVDRLVTSKVRNRQIAEVVDAEIDKGNSILVLSRRIEHLDLVAEAMSNDVEILAAQRRNKKERAEVLANFRNGKVRCVLATQLADEALDVPRLNRVCLIYPGKHEGRIIQQIGRALRKHADKEDAVIYDFVDTKVGVLKHQWKQRRRTYLKEKITIRSSGRLNWSRSKQAVK